MKKLIFISIVIFIVACNSKNNSIENKNILTEGDTISIPVGSPLILKMKTAFVTTEPYHRQIITSGTVKAITNNYAKIATPFSGRIIKSYVKLGQRVNVGSPIFEITSPSYLDACKNYYQTKQQMQLANKNWKRQQDLLKNNVGVKKDLEEAEVNFELTKRDYENASASLNVYNVNPEDLVLGQPLIVRSPIQGEIIENNIVIGQYLKDDAEPVAVVAELSKVWVVGQLKEKDQSRIHENDEVDVKLPCLSDKIIKGNVFHISEMLDEDTRSVQVFIECNNSDRIMKPGMYVTTHFYNAIDSAILIPSKALLQKGNETFVLVKVHGNKYVKRVVDIEGTDKDRVVVKAGLKSGDEIIVEGGFYLMEAK